jgi:hypothetical protein
MFVGVANASIFFSVEAVSQNGGDSHTWQLPDAQTNWVAPQIVFNTGATLDDGSVFYVPNSFVVVNLVLTSGEYPTTFGIEFTGLDVNYFNPNAYAVVSMTILDHNGDGASLTGLYNDGLAYESIYGYGYSNSTWKPMIASFNAPLGGGGVNTSVTGPIFGVIDGQVQTIGEQYYFTLSAYDSMSLTGHFQVTDSRTDHVIIDGNWCFCDKA